MQFVAGILGSRTWIVICSFAVKAEENKDKSLLFWPWMTAVGRRTLLDGRTSVEMIIPAFLCQICWREGGSSVWLWLERFFPSGGLLFLSFLLESGILTMGSWLGLEPWWLLKVITNGSHYHHCPPLPLCYLRQKMIFPPGLFWSLSSREKGISLWLQ